MNGVKRKNILLFYPSNKRSVVIETIAQRVNMAGHNLIVLTTCQRGDLHTQLDRLNVKNYTREISKKPGFLYYLRYVFILISFCKKNNISTIWSHLQECNFPAVIAQYFIKAKVVIFRHHFHAIVKSEGLTAVNKNELVIGNIISRLAKEIVVPSTEVYQGMIKYEKARPHKISIIPYIYDFSLYSRHDENNVSSIRAMYPAKLLIIVASRMIKMKRHDLVLPVFKKLIEEGYDIKVLLLDEGEEKERLEKYVADNTLKEYIYFLGYKKNIIDYLAASDLLVHPSYTEASSSLVKEFGLMKKPVIVCEGVGDFDEYIIHGHNGFLVSPANEAESFEKYIKYIFENPEEGKKMGVQLNEQILKIFSPNPETIQKYLTKS